MEGNRINTLRIHQNGDFKMNQIRKCCKRPGRYQIKYDCGRVPDQELILCEFHYNSDPVFQRNIKTMKEFE